MTEDFKRKLTAILSADVVGYSRLMGEDEAATVKTLETYKGVMFSLIKQHRGRVVDSPGDNLLAEFGSVVDAVQCAVSIQKELQTRNADLPENRRMEFRIGINLGDVIEEQDRIYGDGVNIAARLEALADPGGICISKTAFDYIENKLPFGYRFIGDQTVKNIAKPVGAYKVLMETRLIDEEEQRAKAPIWKRKAVLSIGIIVILVIAGTLYWNFYLRGPSTKSASVEPEQAPAASEVKEAPKTIAVLPFDDISPNKDQEYFVDGLSEEILNSLCQIPGLGVTGKTSSFYFKGKDKTFQQIANELGVDHILEGSVRKVGNELRITAQLVRASDGLHLWSETYDRELKDIFKIQEDIANNVANKLKLTLEAFQILGGTENTNAYELYLAAKGLASTLEESLQALEKINEAISLDKKFALAWTLKANILLELATWNPDYVSKGLDIALETAQKAIELEPMLGKAYLSLGTVYSSMGKFIKAEQIYKKGLDFEFELNDFYAYGIITHYTNVGRLKKAFELIDRMREDDPLHPITCGLYVLVLGSLGDMQGAEKEYKHKKEIFGTNWFVGDVVINGLRIGAKDVITVDYLSRTRVGYAWSIIKANLESPEKGIAELREFHNGDNNLSSAELTNISIGAAYFDDYDFAMDALEESSRINNLRNWKLWLPVMGKVRKTPRFKEFVREKGLVNLWKEYGWPDLCHPVGDDDFECD